MLGSGAPQVEEHRILPLHPRDIVDQHIISALAEIGDRRSTDDIWQVQRVSVANGTETPFVRSVSEFVSAPLKGADYSANARIAVRL